MFVFNCTGIYVNHSDSSPKSGFVAGLAVVPIDVMTPSNRVQKIWKDCKASICLTTSDRWKEVEKFEDLSADQILPVDEFDKQCYQSFPDLPVYAVEENDLAYVIYTSGSSGRPKGS